MRVLNPGRAAATLAACIGLFAALSPLSHAAQPVASAAITVAPIKYTERTLPNGLQVITVPSSTSPTVSVQVWYHVGSKDDPTGRSGFAHLFEHLMFKGSRYLKAEQFDRLTEDVGGSNNASTGDDVTIYQEVVPSNHLEVLLWAEAERMSNLNVDEANFKSERAVVEEEYRQRILASPYGRFSNEVPRAAYLVHPYKRPGIGSIEDLDASTLADVVAFHDTFYRPDNATLIVTGDFDQAQLDGWVDKYFNRVQRPRTPLPRVTTQEPPWPSDRAVTLTGPQVPLPALAMIWLAPPVTSPDSAALQVASALLSSGDSSRLNEALVYRQRVASQASFDVDLKAGPGLLTGVVIAAGGKSLDQAGKAMLSEIQRLARGPIPPAELAKVKTQVLTGAVLTRQTPDGLAAAIGQAAVLEGDTAKVNTDLADLEAVTAADVQRVLQQYVLGAHKVTLRYVQEGASK
jgi:zinc protease